ncbi:uncharacterized protein METZ01_LOCUS113536 [marine metagenome]|uniref:Thioredoxin domain-containing protein n=1 Tax=marine metagenome TaxID=408172 RepID=A0A381X806_9ZZZZ
MSYTIMPGDRAPNFENLLATNGNKYSLKDINLKPITVIFFTCNHCPYVTGSDELTREIANKYKEQVNFVAINSNSQNTYDEDSYEGMVARMEQYKFPWLYLHDATQKIAKEYGALKTPHFFLFDSEWNLIYTGRSNDNPRNTSERTTNELEEAIKKTLSGEKISVSVTNPIGCNVKWDGKPAHWMPAEACDLI